MPCRPPREGYFCEYQNLSRSSAAPFLRASELNIMAAARLVGRPVQRRAPVGVGGVNLGVPTQREMVQECRLPILRRHMAGRVPGGRCTKGSHSHNPR